ncbi:MULTISPECIES: MarR family winged helix-turn-helix transcriptional regulator [unclassified Enterococcus]|uniref:MarR family winged helix-turn-helix transcriptional regulator n=1 Tax=unclassified Enterococcus TaxID=2608891 RepID=UPI003D2CE770
MSLQEVSHILYQIKLADQRIAQLFEEKIGFSLTRYEILMILKEQSPCLQNILLSKMQIDQGAITRHLKLLETKGYVKRERNPANNREVFVELTPKAQQEINVCEREHGDIETILSPAFNREELAQLLVLLDKLNAQLAAIE